MWRFLACLAVMLLAACGPREQGLGPVVGGSQLMTDRFLTADGVELPLRIWRPEDEARAVFLALHGFNDYSRSWERPAEWWATQGVITYAPDQRGFGRAPDAGIWGGVDAMTHDVRSIAGALRRAHPGLPLFIIGESMGAAVAMAATASWAEGRPDGIILAAPGVWGRDTMPWVYRSALWVAAHAMPWNLATGRGLRIRPSDNIEMLRELGRDPLVIKATRADAIWGLVDMMDAGIAAAAKVNVPTLIVYGENDDIVPRPSVEHMLARFGTPYRFALYPDGYHLLFRDLRGAVVWQDVLAWARDQEAPLPSGREVLDRPVRIARSAALSD